MADNGLQLAQATFEAMCKALDKRQWHYDKVPDKLLIKSGVKSEDLPIEFIVRMIPNNQLVQLISPLPLQVAPDKAAEMAQAVCIANDGMIDGSFDYGIENGRIVFRLTSSYRGSILGDELFEYMIMVSASTIDIYNDKFFMIAKGMMTLEQFQEEEKAKRQG